MSIRMIQNFRFQIFIEQVFKIVLCGLLVRFVGGLLGKAGQSSCIQPESGTFGALIDFIIELLAETVAVQQSVNAVGAGMLNIPEHMDSFRAFHVEQSRPGRGIPVFQLFDLSPLEPEPAATAYAGLYFNPRNLEEFQFMVARRAVHRIIILWKAIFVMEVLICADYLLKRKPCYGSHK